MENVTVKEHGKGLQVKAKKLLVSLGAKLSTTPSKTGYNAYVVSMAIAPGTQAQINAGAGLSANNAHPNLHFANNAAHEYYTKVVQHPKVASIPFTTIAPRCTEHGVRYSQCEGTCTYGLYVVSEAKFAHVLLASGTKVKTTKAQKRASTKGSKAPEGEKPSIATAHAGMTQNSVAPK